MNVNNSKLLLFIEAILEHTCMSKNRTCSVGKRTQNKRNHQTIEDPGFAIRARPQTYMENEIFVWNAVLVINLHWVLLFHFSLL